MSLASRRWLTHQWATHGDSGTQGSIFWTYSFQESWAHLQEACRKAQDWVGKATCWWTTSAQKWHRSLTLTSYWLKLVTWSHRGERGCGKCSHFSAITLFYGKRIMSLEGLWSYHFEMKMPPLEKLSHNISTQSYIREVLKKHIL